MLLLPTIVQLLGIFKPTCFSTRGPTIPINTDCRARLFFTDVLAEEGHQPPDVGAESADEDACVRQLMQISKRVHQFRVTLSEK